MGCVRKQGIILFLNAFGFYVCIFRILQTDRNQAYSNAGTYHKIFAHLALHLLVYGVLLASFWSPAFVFLLSW